MFLISDRVRFPLMSISDVIAFVHRSHAILRQLKWCAHDAGLYAPARRAVPNYSGAHGRRRVDAGYYNNPQFEEILAQAEVYTDEAVYKTLMKEAQNILTELDPPVLYYGEKLWNAVLRAEITGYGFNGLYLSAYPFHKMSRTAP